MKSLKRILIALIIIFIAIQFFRPERNTSAAASPQHISSKFSIPDDVTHVLSTSCYDCHSNNTRYPWYFRVQPVAWWLNNHVSEGKRHLNFDEYTSYNLRRQYHKFEEIIEMVQEDEMPLPSYLVMHNNARLNQDQKDKIISWSNSCMDAMKSAYPLDSLVRK